MPKLVCAALDLQIEGLNIAIIILQELGTVLDSVVNSAPQVHKFIVPSSEFRVHISWFMVRGSWFVVRGA